MLQSWRNSESYLIITYVICILHLLLVVEHACLLSYSKTHDFAMTLRWPCLSFIYDRWWPTHHITCSIWNMEDKIILGMLPCRCISPISAYYLLVPHYLNFTQRSKVQFWPLILNYQSWIIEDVERDKHTYGVWYRNIMTKNAKISKLKMWFSVQEHQTMRSWLPWLQGSGGLNIPDFIKMLQWSKNGEIYFWSLIDFLVLSWISY